MAPRIVVALGLSLVIATAAFSQEIKFPFSKKYDAPPVDWKVKKFEEREFQSSAQFDPLTGRLSYSVYSHGTDDDGFFDFGNLRLVFRGWKVPDGFHGSSHSRAFIYPRENSPNGISDEVKVNGGGPGKYTFQNTGDQIKTTFADIEFAFYNSILDLSQLKKAKSYKGPSYFHFTGDRLMIVINEAKEIEEVYSWPKE